MSSRDTTNCIITTRSQQEKKMEKNPSSTIPPTTTISSDQVYGIPTTNPKGYEILVPKKFQPNLVEFKMVHIVDDTNKPHEFTPKELLEMSQG